MILTVAMNPSIAPSIASPAIIGSAKKNLNHNMLYNIQPEFGGEQISKWNMHWRMWCKNSNLTFIYEFDFFSELEIYFWIRIVMPEETFVSAVTPKLLHVRKSRRNQIHVICHKRKFQQHRAICGELSWFRELCVFVMDWIFFLSNLINCIPCFRSLLLFF